MRRFRFCFESYGVRVGIECDSESILSSAAKTARNALVGRIEQLKCDRTDQHFVITSEVGGICTVVQNGETVNTGSPSDLRFWKFFNSLVRILVAEHTKSVVFVHAGVVGWRGHAIVIPGRSFAGKTTLVAELVKAGAEYFSDEYAIFDETGLVHAFPRELSIRTSGPTIHESAVAVEAIGGRAATIPAPARCLLFTKFERESVWTPQLLTAGQGMMEILPQTIAIRQNTEFAIKTLKNAIGNAIIVKSSRPDAANFARVFLEFVDNKAF